MVKQEEQEIDKDPPKETADPPLIGEVVFIVIEELVKAELEMLVKVLVKPEMDLLVKVSVVALPTRVSVASGKVKTFEVVVGVQVRVPVVVALKTSWFNVLVKFREAKLGEDELEIF